MEKKKCIDCKKEYEIIDLYTTTTGLKDICLKCIIKRNAEKGIFI